MSLIIFETNCCILRRSGWILSDSSIGKKPCHNALSDSCESWEWRCRSVGGGGVGNPSRNFRSNSRVSVLQSSLLDLAQKSSIAVSWKDDNILQEHVRMWLVSDSTSKSQHLYMSDGQRPCCFILSLVPAKLQKDLLA